MTGYTLTITCPRCGGEMLPGDSTLHAPDHSSHDARCDRCMDLYRVEITARVLERWPVDLVDPDARLERARAGAAWAVSPDVGFG